MRVSLARYVEISFCDDLDDEKHILLPKLFIRTSFRLSDYNHFRVDSRVEKTPFIQEIEHGNK